MSHCDESCWEGRGVENSEMRLVAKLKYMSTIKSFPCLEQHSYAIFVQEGKKSIGNLPLASNSWHFPQAIYSFVGCNQALLQITYYCQPMKNEHSFTHEWRRSQMGWALISPSFYLAPYVVSKKRGLSCLSRSAWCSLSMYLGGSFSV